MRIGLIGTGAIARLHASVYATLGFPLRVCTDIAPDKGRGFAAEFGAEFVERIEDVCRHPDVDIVDVCTFPDVRLQPVELAAAAGKAVQVQKPMAIDLATARKMIDATSRAGVALGVVSQHRYDDAFSFLARAIREGRLGKLVQCDAYVKWFRSAEYYARPIKGSWKVEGGGALINQAIHQVDLLRWLVGPVKEIFAIWQLGALHKIESEDVVTAVLQYANGAPA
jgi:predicted dehydrogenase